MAPKKSPPKKGPSSSRPKSAVAETVYTFTANPANLSCSIKDTQVTVKCKISGTPRPMYRVQACNNGGRMHVYTVSNTNKKSFGSACQQALGSCPGGNPFSPASGRPVSITAKFFFKRPKSHFGGLGLKADAPEYVTKNPDVDNLMKLVMDSLQGIVYKNDNVVVDTKSTKLWLGGGLGCDRSDRECTLLKITEYKDNTVA
jgi:Holliday junction resolvase RusA-like endonuclease